MLATGLSACAPQWPVGRPQTLRPPVSAPPVLTADTRWATGYRELAREQDERIKTCAARQACDRAHFVRGLMALYESRQAAEAHFHQAIQADPASDVAKVSQGWLALLQDRSVDLEPDGRLAPVLERLVRALLDQERTINRLTANREQERASVEVLQGDLRALQTEVQNRDKKVQELTEQLGALKRIDQETRSKSKAKRPSERPTPLPNKDKTP
jgi:DNA repair exonuclease SbcCD ATPase subunit